MIQRPILKIMIFILLTSCSAKKQLDNMHDATLVMKESTQQLNEKTDDIKSDSDSLLQLTEELYDSLRQGDAVKIRQAAWNDSLKAQRIEEKLAQSALYFMSFEFQLWNNYGQDLLKDKRLSLQQQAAMEFFVKIESIAPQNYNANPLASPLQYDIGGFGEIFSDSNKNATFNSMAAAMHKINRKQFENLKKMNLQETPISFLTIIEQALEIKILIDSGKMKVEEAPKFALEVLAHQEVVIALLETRVQFLTTMFLMTATGLQQKSVFTQAREIYLNHLLNKRWLLDLTKWDRAQKYYYQTEVLDQALHTKKILQKMGISIQFNKYLLSLIRRMNVKTTTNIDQLRNDDEYLILQSLIEIVN